MSRRGRRLPGALASLALCLLAGCGSTVGLGSVSASSSGTDLSSSLGIPQQTPTGSTAPDAAFEKTAPETAPTDVAVPADDSETAPSIGAPTIRTSTPLNVGVVYTTNQSAIQGALGASADSAVSYESIAKALVDGINALGGLAGHRLVPVYYGQNPQAGDFSTDAQAACELFTKDHHVPVVLDLAFGTLGGFQACLKKAAVLDITSSYEPDAVESRAYSLHANTSFMSVDRTYEAVLRGLTASGYVSAKNQLGVMIEGCAANNAAYDHTVAPLIKALGLKAPVISVISCVAGYNGIPGAASQIEQTQLKFHAQGVDRVMFVSTNEVVALLLFAQTAQTQGYTPGYALSSNAQAALIRPSLAKPQRPQLHGIGIYPVLDTDAATGTSAVEKRCFELSLKGRVPVGKYDDYGTLYSSCAPFLLLESALKRNGGGLSSTELASGIAALGTTFADPGMVGGGSRYSSSQHDGPDKVREFGYVESCACIHYIAPAKAAP